MSTDSLTILMSDWSRRKSHNFKSILSLVIKTKVVMWGHRGMILNEDITYVLINDLHED